MTVLHRLGLCRKGDLRQSDVRQGQPAALPSANLRLLRSHRRATKGRRLVVQYRRQLGPGSRVLCRTLAFQGRRLPLSGSAESLTPKPSSSFRAVYCAVMTLYSKIATASRSREISQINDYDGLTPPAAMPQRRPQTVRRTDVRQGQPAALPSANLRLLRNHLLPKEGGYPLSALQHYLTLTLTRHFERW